MTTSRAAVFHGQAGRLELLSLATPVPQPGEILTRVLGCTLCGSDLHSVEGRRTVPVPTILGHEIVGEIQALGPDTRAQDLTGQPLGVGDRVTWGIVANCGSCFYCQRDLPQKCLRAVKYGHEAFRPGRELLGGLAEHCLLVPGTSLLRVPDELPLEVACPASCATATVAAALESAGEIRDRVIAVLGAGMLGLTACAMARAAGAADVVCVDRQPARCARAQRFGATLACGPEDFSRGISERTEGRGADVVLELTGSNAAFESVWPHVRLGGRIVLVGAVFASNPVPIALEQLVRRQLTLSGIHNYAPRHLVAAMKFLAENHERFPFANLVTAWHDLDDVARAFTAASDAGAIRIGVRPANLA